MKIEIPSIKGLHAIDKIAVQIYECHVKWRNDIFEHTNGIISEENLKIMIDKNSIFVAKIENRVVGYIILSSKEDNKNGYRYRKELDIDAMGVGERNENAGHLYEAVGIRKDGKGYSTDIGNIKVN